MRPASADQATGPRGLRKPRFVHEQLDGWITERLCVLRCGDVTDRRRERYWFGQGRRASKSGAAVTAWARPTRRSRWVVASAPGAVRRPSAATSAGPWAAAKAPVSAHVKVEASSIAHRGYSTSWRAAAASARSRIIRARRELVRWRRGLRPVRPGQRSSTCWDQRCGLAQGDPRVLTIVLDGRGQHRRPVAQTPEASRRDQLNATTRPTASASPRARPRPARAVEREPTSRPRRAGDGSGQRRGSSRKPGAAVVHGNRHPRRQRGACRGQGRRHSGRALRVAVLSSHVHAAERRQRGGRYRTVVAQM